ncbi:helix-turn-helix domain-containing protein [Salsuginibacillus kocurii]|uniref:helix-turn-helix domain-containing protein n=1 Tax=Salsuginibacillus kocurii TaxID=427078 RepID=UPI00037737EE|nr:helix-turn-helix domain-containing protein [Salsuginibacillus kocurii]
MTTTHLSNANLSEYKQLSPFATIDELNTSIRNHLYHNTHHLAKSAVSVFKLLSQHSVKATGIAFMKYQTIAEQLEISFSTVRRAITLLKQHQMIEVHRTIRQKGELKGGYGHSVFIITPFLNNADQSPEHSTLNTRNSTKNSDKSGVESQKTEGETGLSESSNLLDLKERTTHSKQQTDNKTSTSYNPTHSFSEQHNLPATYTPSYVPEAFVKAVKPIFDDAVLIDKLWSKVCLAYSKCNLDYSVDEYIDNVLEAFKSTVLGLKKGKVNSMCGYFYGAVSRVFERVFSNELYGVISN